MALGRYLIPSLVGGMLLSAQLGAQGTGGISGRVLDSASQQPIVGASVRIEGTQRGALSRDDGGFSMSAVPEGTHRLRVTRIGYGPMEQTVAVTGGGTANVTFLMPRRAALIEGVVTVGYGTQRREAITGSVATVEPSEANVGVVTNPQQMLQGRVAGITMVTNNGEPGSSSQIRVRGGTSLSASNDPLYVVDGVPLQNEGVVAGAAVNGVNAALGRNPLNTINPNDIESISVLKDASATAIYGSRGANGVILIQTKRGSRGGSVVEYDTYIAAASAARKLDLASGNEYKSFVQGEVSAGRLPSSQLAALGNANTNWEDELTRQGYATSHNLSFSGGSQTTRYRASLNYFDQQGVVISSGLKRYQGRLNGTQEAINGRLNLGLNLTASRVLNDYVAMENGGGFTGGLFTNMAIFNPTQPVRITDASGTRFYEIGTGAQGTRNPVALAEQIDDRAPENRILGNLTGSFSILPSLTAQTTVGADYTNSTRQTYIPRVSPIGAEFNGVARQAERSLQNLNFQQLLTFAPGMGDNHELEVVGGYEYSQFDNSGFEVIMQGFVTDNFTWNNFGGGTQAGSPVPVSYRQESKLVSFFSRANYGFQNKYFLTGVVRYDGSSRLAEGHKWSVFPALSASWRLSQEAFMRNSPFSNLSLRAGWGRQGNQAVKPYGTQLLLRTDNGARYPFGGVVTTGLVATQVANPDLKWETSDQVNVGIDYGFRNDRLTGVIDFYQKTTHDLLFDAPVPQPAVVATRTENIGSIRNRGFEATLDANLIDRPTRSFTSGLVLSMERNKVLDLGAERKFIITGNVNGQGQSGRFAQRIMLDEPLGTFWGPQFVHVQNGKQYFKCNRQATDCVNGLTLAPTAADEAIIGNANPNFSLGFRSNGRWSRFDASWLWRGEFGKDVFNNTALIYSTKGNAKQGRNFLRSALTAPDSINEPSIFSSRWIENGSFFRLQNVTVGYTFDLPGRFGGRATRVYLSGDNVLLFTGYDGYDPEVHTDLGLASRGIDYLTYPRARTFTLGAHVQF